MSAVLEALSLQKSYRRPMGDGRLEILRNVSLAISSGERVAIMGKSGSGKSTLLHILGLLDDPNGGHVQIDGRDAASLSDETKSRLRATRLGFVFQSHYLLPEFSALENVMMPALLLGRSRTQARKRAEELLGHVGLGERAEHRPSELSGGEAQRVAVARALMNHPGIILADEPTGNLDAANGLNVVDTLVDLVKGHAVALLVVTHDEKIASRMDRILKLESGEIRGV